MNFIYQYLNSDSAFTRSIVLVIFHVLFLQLVVTPAFCSLRYNLSYNKLISSICFARFKCDLSARSIVLRQAILIRETVSVRYLIIIV